MNSKDSIKILSLDGGGMKGYIECKILAELEKRTGKKCNEIFDGFTGTSIGGILVGLLSIGVSAENCLKFFTVDGKEIFKKKWYSYLFFKPKYSAKSIEKVLFNKFLFTKLKSVNKKLLITSVDINTEKPIFFKSYKQDGEDFYLRDCCRATSAAQTFFPLLKLNDYVLMDGGNVANNPSLCAYIDIHKLGYSDENIKILSLGCGQEKIKRNGIKYISANAIKMLLLTFGILFDSNSEDVDYHLNELIGENYLRINPVLTQKLLIDDASESGLKKLEFEANKSISENYSKIEKFLFS